MFDAQFVAFLLVALILTVTPGADTMLVIRNAARSGARDGAVTAVGIVSGVFVHAVLSALGLSVLLAKSATAFHAVKLAGALYLVWLGVQSLRAARRGGELVATGAPCPPRSGHRAFLEGLLTNLLNPKVAVFYLAFLPQFIGPGDPVLARSLLMALVHNVIGIVWLGGIALAVGRSRRWVAHPSVKRWLDTVSGGVLVALGVRLALEKR
jgi:RhtB (resistance to homoserine/threonine) family protein